MAGGNGRSRGRVVANLYLSNLEKHWLSTIKPVFYVRFIDDIFVILLNELDKEYLESFFENLKINICSGKSVNFLDLVISIDKLCNTLQFSLFIKKTNTFQYLLSDSNHPKFIIKKKRKAKTFCASSSICLQIKFFCSISVSKLLLIVSL